MEAQSLFLAVFLGNPDNPKMAAWKTLSDAERHQMQQDGIALWKAWVEKYQSSIVTMGGPLGKTKCISTSGIEDISNALTAFTVVQAESHDAAAKMFENHPHFAHFPGDSVEVMPVLPIPGA